MQHGFRDTDGMAHALDHCDGTHIEVPALHQASAHLDLAVRIEGTSISRIERRVRLEDTTGSFHRIDRGSAAGQDGPTCLECLDASIAMRLLFLRIDLLGAAMQD
ncbi:hypothetical protein X739_28120 [Mesorhizobium sp. LNHC220B00]|nr:hypothetical protein X739_28120 [Mesorhizobium sp. LNHC220B00]